MSAPIDIEAAPAPAQGQAAPNDTLALQRVEFGAIGRAMSLEELHENLEFIRNVMHKEMREGQDFGKIPGTGDKPTLLQPGAQKLLMTFNLTEAVKREVLREYPGWHREYEFTVVVRAPNGKEWDGVGTCSTLESKYRWRKQERRCPTCGKHTIIAGKEEYGGGWLCWAKKGGCGAKFAFNDTAITSQPSGRTENPDIADQWNTCRKMAFKRALVAAAINATNTSELWTQDLEENAPDGGDSEPAPAPAKPVSSPPRAPKPRQGASAPAPTPAAKPSRPTCATEATRAWALDEVEKAGLLEYLPEYLEALDNPAQLLPGENLQDWPLPFIPINRGELNLLLAKLRAFSNGEQAETAFPQHPERLDPKAEMAARAHDAQHGELGSAPLPAKHICGGAEKQAQPVGVTPGAVASGSPAPAAAGINVPRDPPGPPPLAADAEWFMRVIVPVPHAGEKRDEYLKHPDTIGSLYEMRHGNDEESQAARQRLWGFCANFEAKPWVGRDGAQRPPSQSDIKFRQALDAFAEWFQREHPGEKL